MANSYGNMKAYAAIFSARFRVLLQYRAAAIAGLVTQLCFGAIRMMIFIAFYESASEQIHQMPLTLKQTVGYIWLGQAFLGLILFRPDPEIGELIRTGRVAYELLRPVNLYKLWFARTLANRLTPTIMRAVPMLVLALITGWLAIPQTKLLTTLLVTLPALTSSLVLASSIAMLMSLSLFWTLDGRGISLLIGGTTFILSGMIVPLPLMPESLQTIIRILPFRGILDTPFRIFLGAVSPGELPELLGSQLAWSIALIFIGRCLSAKASKQLIIQGG